MRHDLKECGKRIQQFRKERGLTQEQLAEKLNVSENTIAKIESGLRRPSIDFLLELSDLFRSIYQLSCFRYSSRGYGRLFK